VYRPACKTRLNTLTCPYLAHCTSPNSALVAPRKARDPGIGRSLMRRATAQDLSSGAGRYRCGQPPTAPVRQCERDIVKTLAFVIGLYILAVGAIGICAPSSLVWIAQRFTTPVDWYALTAVRVAVGGLLSRLGRESVASAHGASCCRPHPTWRRTCDTLCGSRACSGHHCMVVVAGIRRRTSLCHSTAGSRRLHRVRLRPNSTRCLTLMRTSVVTR
jgi:hypothetical protein